MTDTPNPGSAEAIKLGCTCPVIDNRHGEGVPYRGGVSFWINPACPLHAKELAVAMAKEHRHD